MSLDIRHSCATNRLEDSTLRDIPPNSSPTRVRSSFPCLVHKLDIALISSVDKVLIHLQGLGRSLWTGKSPRTLL